MQLQYRKSPFKFFCITKHKNGTYCARPEAQHCAKAVSAFLVEQASRVLIGCIHPDWYEPRRDRLSKPRSSCGRRIRMTVLSRWSRSPPAAMCLQRSDAILYDERSYGTEISDTRPMLHFGVDQSSPVRLPSGFDTSGARNHFVSIPLRCERRPWAAVRVRTPNPYDYGGPPPIGLPWVSNVASGVQPGIDNSTDQPSETYDVLYH
ncbi:hypothetical protein BJ170DRAFT_495673 [Xylariales sp. AK1849]|nr:hypothetical protein BJ170DRAFT_495673 [Xylariales sp. AK1849]